MKEAWWLIDQLVQQGVRRFCIAPGSRSAPLALAAREHPKATTVVHFDERGLGFYALGYAMGSKEPVALIVTSGTAVANLIPSVLEAHHSCTPLLLLTADRPCELRDCGANQTADQVKIFCGAVRWQSDLAPTLEEKTVRSIGAHAVFCALQNPPGPVHLNCQFREPLYIPPSSLSQGTPLPLSFPHFLPSKPLSVTASRGIIFIGPISTDVKPILQLGQRLQWPIFADILSNARCSPTPEQIRHFDWILQTKRDLQPDLLLHFGGRLTAKSILEWDTSAPLIHVSPFPFLQDPSRRLSQRIQSDIPFFCERFEAKSDPSWLNLWQKWDAEMKTLLEEHFQSPYTEAHAFRSLNAPRAIFLGNSMPIRDADHFLFPSSSLGFFANRGLSGIDGHIATAAGLFDGLKTPLLACIGDQAALFDLNSLPLLKNQSVLLLIFNNFGGGIFSHLPAAKSPHFETLFAASHSWHFREAARMFDLPYVQWEKLPSQLPTSGIAELITSREKSVQFHKQLLAACSQVLA